MTINEYSRYGICRYTNLNIENTIIALDLDGTTLRTDKSVSDFTVETLRALSEKGAEISFVTGRRKRVAEDVLKPFSFPSRLIANNGTSCYNRPTGKKIYTCHFPREKVEFAIQILSEIERAPVLIIEENDERRDMIMQKSHLEKKVYKDYFERNSDFIFVEKNLRNSFFINKITGMFLSEPNEEIESVISFLKSKTNSEFHYCPLYNLNFLPTHTILEILQPEMTKWNGICHLKKLIGKENARVFAFGDDHNDIDMLTHADESYAMANAVAEAKSAAKNIAPSNEDDGVAKILAEKFL